MQNSASIVKTQEILQSVIEGMLDCPDSLRVTAVSSPAGVYFRVACHSSDICKLIGKQGRTARALRTVLMALSRETAYHLDIRTEPELAAPGVFSGQSLVYGAYTDLPCSRSAVTPRVPVRSCDPADLN